MTARPPLPEFLKWAEARGAYVHPALDVFGLSARRGRGVMAKEAIREGEQLMLIPIDLCIHSPTDKETEAHENSTCDAVLKDGFFHPSSRAERPIPYPFVLQGCTPQRSEAKEHLRTQHPDLSPLIATTLLLLHEFSKGPESKFAPYLAILPDSHHCLLSWTQAERDLLKGTSLWGQEADVEGLFERNVAPIMLERPDLWPPAATSFTRWQHVAGLVQSRAFHLESHNWVTGASSTGEELYLIPGIDMINHAVLPAERSTSLQMAQETLTVACGPQGDPITFTGFFTMKAERDIAEGEEVCHSYGDLSDAQLLQTYGFVEEVPRQPSDASCWYSFREKYLAGGGREGANPNGVQGEAPGNLRSEEKSAGKCDPSGSVRVETGSAAGGRSMELGSNPNNRLDLPISALVDACSAVWKDFGYESTEADMEARRKLLECGRVFDCEGAISITAGDPLPDRLLTAAQVLMCKDDTQLADVEAGMREALGEGEPFDLELDPPDGATFMGQMVGMALMGLANSQLRQIPGEFEVGIPPAEPDQATGPPHEPKAAGGPHVDPVRAWLAAM